MSSKGMDKYVRVKQIGEGSFGKALLVKSKENGRHMVVKEINMVKMGRKERDESRKEVAVLAQLQHPNIVSYRESFEEIGNLYIVMDYCDGGDLYARINAQRGILFKEEQILDWFVQISLAIKHIHDRKILHRDIKSQNIFLTKHGIVKLGDFGIAKVLNNTMELARTCIGTPYYLSPEICENKPYNNKSDIWSLGCVLYELATLKHAFEAGNMKNLVLKIIRGNYPPPPSKYSYDLRGLQAALFKRSARDRPSINNVLKKPLLQSRIRKFLNDSELASEFSHTVMHGLKIQKALPAGGGRPLPPKPIAARPVPSPVNAPRPGNAAIAPRHQPAKRAPTPVRYDPSSVYGPSVARKSKDSRDVRKSAEGKRPVVEVRRSGGSAAKKSALSAAERELERRKRELMEKERKRRDELKKKEDQCAKLHKDLLEKQKQARLSKAKEEGWKNLLSSLDSTGSEKSDPSSKGDSQKDEAEVRVPPAKPAQAPAGQGGKYDHYHAYLEKLEQNQKANVVIPQRGFNPGLAAQQGQVAGVKASEAASKARQRSEAAGKPYVVNEFLDRKRVAAANKAKGQANIHGNIHGNLGVAGAISPRVGPGPTPSPRPSDGRPQSARSEREKQEQEYLAKLKQIRLQNFNERRMQKDNKPPANINKPPSGQDADLRRKKIEALRAQADERARQLKVELEKKRNNVGPSPRPAMPAKQTPVIAAKPAPVVPVTEVMKAVGINKELVKPVLPPKPAIGMTAAMQAIGATPSEKEPVNAGPKSPPVETLKSIVQQQKSNILKRLNAKVSDTPRTKWGEPSKSVDVNAERPRWAVNNDVALSQMVLEETGGNMEATNAGDVVLKHQNSQGECQIENEVDPKARRKWGKDVAAVEEDTEAQSRKQWCQPGRTVVNVLSNARLVEAQTIPNIIDIDPEESLKDKTAAHSAVPSVGDNKDEADNTENDKKLEKVTSSDGQAPLVVGNVFTIHHDPEKGKVIMTKAEPQVTIEVTDEAGANSSALTTIHSKDDNTNSGTTEEVQYNILSSSQPGDSLFEKIGNVKDEEEKLRSAEQVLLLQDVENDDEDIEKVNLVKSLMQNDDLKGRSLERGQHTKNSSDIKFGLTTGHFDVDVKMLRTCSEPDMSKLFHTQLSGDGSEGCVSPGEIVDEADDNDDLDDLEEAMKHQLELESNDEVDEKEEENAEDDDVEAGEVTSATTEDRDNTTSDESKDRDGEDDEEKSEDKAEDGDDEHQQEDEDDNDIQSSEDDLETMRQSMLNLLENEDDDGEESIINSATTKKKKKKKSILKSKKLKRKTKKKTDSDSDGERQSNDQLLSARSVEDFRNMRETMQSLLQPEDSNEAGQSRPLPVLPEGKLVDAKLGAAGDAAPPLNSSTLLPGIETWQSDDDGDDDFFEEEDMFSRLEASRVKLEEELGFEVFSKAYKSVQAIHEDEDESMEDGLVIISKLLGPKAYLYPQILQLVMGDGAFMEDNN